MKKLLIMFTLLVVNISYSQYRTTRQNGVLGRTEEFESNSPGNMIANSILLAYYKDHSAMGFAYPSIEFWNFTSIRNDGTPTSIAWFDSNGFLKRSPIPTWLTTEVDPQWNTEKVNYYDKTTSDGRYLQGFTELDPTIPLYSKSLNAFSVIKTSTDLLYKTIEYTPTSLEITTALTYTPYNGILNPLGFINTVPAQTWTSITGKPSFATVATTGSYNDLINKPTIKRQETYSGTTNVSGVYTVTFGTAYIVAPNIQANIVGGTPNQFITMTRTTTGFTCTVYQRNTVNLLSTELLLGTTVLVNGATVDVLITER